MHARGLSIPKIVPKKQPPSTFAERLAYARWVRQLTRNGPEESDKDLAAAVEVSTGWLAKWKIRDDAPPGHREITALAGALAVSWKWLAGQEDHDPPLPALWRDWFSARRGVPVDASSDRYATTGEFIPEIVPYVDAMEDAERREAEEEAAAKAARITKRGR